MKKVITAFVLAVLLLCIAQPALAAYSPSEHGGVSSYTVEHRSGILERAVAGIINAIVVLFEALEKALDLDTIDKLVFNKGLSESEKKMLPFGQENWDKLKLLYQGMAACFGILVIVAIVVTAIKMMVAGVNPRMRQEAGESVWRWVLAIVFIAAAPIIFWVVLNINTYMVDAMQTVVVDAAGKIDSLAELRLSGLSSGESTAVQIKTGSVLGDALVKLMICGVSLYLNLLYMVRKFALSVIFVFTPVMAWMWTLNKNVNAAGIWFGELLSNAFMQTAHALVFLVYLTTCTATEFGTNWLESIVWMMILIPVAEMIRNSVQGLFTRLSGVDEAGAVGKAMGIFGLASLVGLGGLAKSTVGGSGPPGIPVAGSSGGPAGPGSGGVPGLPVGGGPAGQAGGGVPGLPVGSGPAGGAGSAAVLAGGGLAGMPGGGSVTAPGSRTPAGGDVAGGSSHGTAFGEGGRGVQAGGEGSAGGAHGLPSGEVSASRSSVSPAPEGGAGAVRSTVRTRAINTGRKIGNAAAVAGGLMGKAMFMATPHSREAQEFMTRAMGHVGGAVGRVGGMAAGTLWQAYREKKSGGSAGSMLQEAYGGRNAAESAANFTRAAVIEAVSPRINDLDGHRWR